jgi:arabinofuranosyltransferase
MRARILILSIVLAALLLAGLYLLHYIPDDTFITLRYARNAVRGEGLVFNTGERLEGYTNFLWMMILVLAGKLGASLLPAARTLSFVFSMATLVVTGIAAFGVTPREAPGGWNRSLGIMLPPLMLAASSPFLTWSLSGTEMPLFTFLLVTGFVLLRERRPPAAVFTIFGLLSLVRPEGLLFYALAGLIMLIGRSRKRDVIAGGALILILFYAPYLVWKWRYFGGVVPNTFFAKMGPFRLNVRNGTRYLLGFLASYGYLLVLGLILKRRKLSDHDAVSLPVSFVLVHWIAVFFLGGDWMPHFRFMLPTLPLIFLVASNGLMAAAAGVRKEEYGDRPERQKWRNPVPVVAVMLVCLAMIPGGVKYDYFQIERSSVRVYARLGERLAEILPPGTRIACGSTGAIGYFSDMHIIDILGLTEARIARHGKIVASQPGHMKTDGKYVLERQPDLLLLGNIRIHRGMKGRSEMKHKVQESDIIMQPRFLSDYEFVNLPLGNNFYLSCYKRKAYFLPL